MFVTCIKAFSCFKREPVYRSKYSDEATGWTIRDSGPDIGRSILFLSSKISSPAVGPTHPLIQWKAEAFHPGKSNRGFSLITRPIHCGAVKTECSYLSIPPVQLPGVCRKNLSFYFFVAQPQDWYPACGRVLAVLPVSVLHAGKVAWKALQTHPRLNLNILFS